MHNENSQIPDNSSSSEVARKLVLLRALESGALDGIECPNCHQHTVSVWFTHPTDNEYRTWFICGECTFEMRAQNTSRPRFYTAERVNNRLDEYDREVRGLRRLHP
jgi:hypothetical protein